MASLLLLGKKETVLTRELLRYSIVHYLHVSEAIKDELRSLSSLIHNSYKGWNLYMKILCTSHVTLGTVTLTALPSTPTRINHVSY